MKKCDKCGANVDHTTFYSFILGKKLAQYCDECYAAYLKDKRKKPVLTWPAKGL